MDKVYDTYLSRDPQMKVKSRVEFPVVKGASDYTTQIVDANSASTSSVNFSWTPPSESTFISRKALIRSTLTFTSVISGTTVAGGVINTTNLFNTAAPAGQLGAVCMQSFPFHRCATNVQTTLNNSQIDIDMPSYLPAMLQLIDQEEFREFSHSTPVMMDRFLNYSDYLANSNNSPFVGYDASSYDSKLLARGCFPITITNVDNNAGGGDATSLLKVADGQIITVTFTVSVVEPVLLPPWCVSKYGDEYADAFLGVNRINLKYSLTTAANRVLSSALPMGTVVTTLTNVSDDTALLIQYKNSDATVLIPERCIYPFWQVYNYTTSFGAAMAAGANPEVNFSNLQLSEVPSLIVVYAREQVSRASARSSDFFLPISNLSFSFNNRVSLLSQFTPSELYSMSKRNGLKNVDFFQFLGSAQVYDDAKVSLATANLGQLFLAGSIVVIDPARDLSISSPYISNASTGQFNLSWKATVKNNKATDVYYELVTLLFNSRMLLCASGRSEIIQPALNQEQVAKTIESGIQGMDYPNEVMLGGQQKMEPIVRRGIGGASRSGGSRSGGASKSKLDMLLM